MKYSVGPGPATEPRWQYRKRRFEAYRKAQKAAQEESERETKALTMYESRRQAEAAAARLRKEIEAIETAWAEHEARYGASSAGFVFRDAIGKRAVELARVEVTLAVGDYITVR